MTERTAIAVSEAMPGSAQLDEVKALHDRQKALLGPFPYSVFDLRAEDGTVVVATVGDAFAGYVLYELALSRVRLIHLCVPPDFRRLGIARHLIEYVSEKHANLRGIRVRCRADYAAAAAWPKLGFNLTNEMPGRGSKPTQLQVWWRQHRVEDLFTSIDDDDRLLAVLDHNVFLDLADPNRNGAHESQVLHADWFTDRLRLALTPESGRETGRLIDHDQRLAQLRRAGGYEHLTVSSHVIAEMRDLIAQRISMSRLSESDFNHLVYAAAAGADVFITRDEDLVRTAAAQIVAATGLRIMVPSDVVAHLDELAEAQRYRPVSVQGSGFRLQDTGSGGAAQLQHLLSTGGGERRRDWNELLRGATADPAVRCQHLTDPTGHVIAAWAQKSCKEHSTLEVPYLRIVPDVTGRTVLRHLLLELRARAVDAGCLRILVTDPCLTDRVRLTLRGDGFGDTGAGPAAFTLPVTSARSAAKLLPAGDERTTQLHRQVPVTSRRITELESELWPAKLLELPLPCYLISIQPPYARELFSLDDTLLDRPTLLALSREHVYYRSSRNSPRSPARVLWYASGAGNRRHGIGAVVAASRLVGVTTGDPELLYARFARYGVWSLQQVTKAARGSGVVSALRIADTERLTRPVPFERLHDLATEKSCQIGTLLSPTAIPAELYEAIYLEGAGRV